MLINQKPNFLFRLIVRDFGKCEYAYVVGESASSFLLWYLICQNNDVLGKVSCEA